MISRIYLDLDGVLADPVKRFRELWGENPWEIGSQAMWARINEYEADGEWFVDVEAKPDGQLLYEGCVKTGIPVMILSATGWNYDNVTYQKKRWCKTHFDIDPERIITVQKSEHKAQYAQPDVVLIDDSHRSIDPWVEAGGMGILHTSALASLMRLSEIIVSER